MEKDLIVYRLRHCSGGDNITPFEHIVDLQVGAALSCEDVCDLKDNTGDNISHLNQIYLETTGHYWVWKNAEKSKYVGFEHYSRHINIPKEIILNLLSENEIIMLKPSICNVKEQYAKCHSATDIENIKNIVLELYPEYTESWDRYITNGKLLLPCNSFITKWEIFDDMWSFITNVLNKFSENFNLNTIEDYRAHVSKYYNLYIPERHSKHGITEVEYQLRMFGALSERLVTLYVLHNIPLEKIQVVDYEQTSSLPYLKHNVKNDTKKAVILVMSCNKERFINEEKIVRETWGKEILQGKYPNIKLIFYRGGAEKPYYDEENNMYFSTEDDDLDGTYNKTIDAFSFVHEKYKDYDYIIRTNTTTYINIDAIRQFLEFKENYANKVIGTKVVLNYANFCTPFIGGHFIIFGREIMEILLNIGLKPLRGIDDTIIGFMLGKKFGTQYTKHLLYVDGFNSLDSFSVDSLSKMYSVKLRDIYDENNNILNMKKVDQYYKDLKITTNVLPPSIFCKYVETAYGVINV